MLEFETNARLVRLYSVPGSGGMPLAKRNMFSLISHYSHQDGTTTYLTFSQNLISNCCLTSRGTYIIYDINSFISMISS